MDAFFASVEQLDNPELKGKPIAVGGSSDRGVVAAASYEARKFGVRSAMPAVKAKELCPELIFVKVRHWRYKELSDQIRKIFFEYTDLVEPLSIDEAYLDLTENKKGIPSASLIAEEIRQRIKNELGLTASAGISINKFLAKTASDINKPDGQKLIAPEEAEAFLEELEIDRFYGVGKVTAMKMKSHGIFNGKDLKSKSIEDLEKWFGKAGKQFYYIARAQSSNVVSTNRIRKSVGAESTFGENLIRRADIELKLKSISEELIKRLRKNDLKGKSLSLKIKFSDFKIQSKTLSRHTYLSEDEIFNLSIKLLDETNLEKSIRLIGLTVSKLNNQKENKTPKEGIQLTLKF